MYIEYRKKIDLLEKAIVIFTNNLEYDTSFLKHFDIPVFLENDQDVRNNVGLIHENPAYIIYGCPDITVLRGEHCKKTILEILKKYTLPKVRRSERLSTEKNKKH